MVFIVHKFEKIYAMKMTRGINCLKYQFAKQKGHDLKPCNRFSMDVEQEYNAVIIDYVRKRS